MVLAKDVTRLTGWFLTHGRTSISDGSGVIESFEQEFRAMTGSTFALAMNSGTAALHSAYFAVGVGPGTEVIVPSYTWHATATPILQCGAVPVFCDIDEDTLTLDPADVERRLTSRTRAVCAVHLWGNPAKLDTLREITKRRGVALIEDCSHAHGAQYDGRSVGSWGDVGCFSLHASKPVAGGEAGVAVTDDPVMHDRMVLLGHVGRARSGHWTHGIGVDKDDLGVTDLGVKYRPHAFAVHLARSQLRRLPSENARRRMLWTTICEQLATSRTLKTPNSYPLAERGGFYRFVVRHVGDADTTALVEAAKRSGLPVEIEPYAQHLLHQSPLFAKLDRTRLGGGCFDPTRPATDTPHQVTLPSSEAIRDKLVSFDQLSYLAGADFVGRVATSLSALADR
jgi:dTDP-4-amino-4,6-dideoxygalactose transaminase